jgi:hypothetical protein
MKDENLKDKITKDFPEIYSDCFDFSIGKGWYKIVYKLTEEIRKVDKNVKVLQVKEKMGLFVTTFQFQKKKQLIKFTH